MSHTKEQEARLRKHLERQRKKTDRYSDKHIMEVLDNIHQHRDPKYQCALEGEVYRLPWRLEGYEGGRRAFIVISRKAGSVSPIITISEMEIPDWQTNLEGFKKQVEDGQHRLFNDLREGGYIEEYLGFADIWHRRELRIEKKNGKPVFTVYDVLVSYGTKWG